MTTRLISIDLDFPDIKPELKYPLTLNRQSGFTSEKARQHVHEHYATTDYQYFNNAIIKQHSVRSESADHNAHFARITNLASFINLCSDLLYAYQHPDERLWVHELTRYSDKVYDFAVLLSDRLTTKYEMNVNNTNSVSVLSSFIKQLIDHVSVPSQQQYQRFNQAMRSTSNATIDVWLRSIMLIGEDKQRMMIAFSSKKDTESCKRIYRTTLSSTGSSQQASASNTPSSPSCTNQVMVQSDSQPTSVLSSINHCSMSHSQESQLEQVSNPPRALDEDQCYDMPPLEVDQSNELRDHYSARDVIDHVPETPDHQTRDMSFMIDVNEESDESDVDEDTPLMLSLLYSFPSPAHFVLNTPSRSPTHSLSMAEPEPNESYESMKTTVYEHSTDEYSSQQADARDNSEHSSDEYDVMDEIDTITSHSPVSDDLVTQHEEEVNINYEQDMLNRSSKQWTYRNLKLRVWNYDRILVRANQCKLRPWVKLVIQTMAKLPKHAATGKLVIPYAKLFVGALPSDHKMIRRAVTELQHHKQLVFLLPRKFKACSYLTQGALEQLYLASPTV